MKTRRIRMPALRRVGMIVFLLIVCLASAFAEEEARGLIFSTDFSGSGLDSEWIFKLDPAIGYQFNRHFEIDAGLPVYFIRVPESSTAGYSSKNGIGNAYLDLRFKAYGSVVGFSSTIRGTAPTGDKDQGFSSGRMTVDWTNYLDFSLGRWTPFVSGGLANTVSDTHFFTRPFTSLGLIGHVEGGLTFDPASWISVGGSGYAVLPTGGQKIYSKIMNGKGNGNSDIPESYGNYQKGKKKYYDTDSVTIGDSEIAEDRGYSAWVDLFVIPNVTLEAGYSRSMAYETDSIFFSVRFDLASMLRKPKKQ